jgi:glycosyltransferase involved in cell wall biosynthesis
VIGNNRRSNQLDGHNIRYGGASASGTDTSAILVAEYLAAQGHEVVIACEHTIPGRVSYGVTYTNLNFDNIDDKTFDILVTMLWVKDYDELPVKATQGIIYWSHMQWLYGSNDIVQYAKKYNLKVGIAHVSEWEKDITQHTITGMRDIYPDIAEKVIPNPLVVDVIEEVRASNIPRQKNKFVFHATWARGGRITYDVVDALPWENKELNVFDYLMNIDINWGRHSEPLEPKEFFKNCGGSDKKRIFEQLASAEYFLYPLYTPYNDVHKDTFSCVIAEALAMGCQVITYPLGAVPEYYKEYCHWLPIPKEFDVEVMQKEPLTKDLNGVFTHIEPIVEFMEQLKDNKELRDQYSKNGQQYVTEMFNPIRVGKMWEDLIAEMGVT